jgi:hypothetical protein
VCLFSSYWLTGPGVRSLTLFGLLPLVLGVFVALAFNIQTENAAVVAGSLSAILSTTLCSILGWPGAAYIFLAWPISIPLAVLGAWVSAKGA